MSGHVSETYITGCPVDWSKPVNPENFKLSTANWTPFFGNNHVKIQRPDVTAGGCVTLNNHLGKPLSQYLWEDLIHRLIISGLCVYRYHDAQWCVGWGEGKCIVNLDEKENISSISFWPYQSRVAKDL